VVMPSIDNQYEGYKKWLSSFSCLPAVVFLAFSLVSVVVIKVRSSSKVCLVSDNQSLHP